MIKEFNSIEEIQKYYDDKTNTYVFKENDEYIDLVVFRFDLDVKANISARDINIHNIYARNINAWDINTWNIKARDIHIIGDINANDIKANDIQASDIYANDINAMDINYYAICVAYKNIKCKSIKGRRNNAKHFVLDGALEVEND